MIREETMALLDAIVDTLIEVGRIELRNFGVFEVKLRKARKARNPRTGDKVDVPPKHVVTFKPGKEMEERVRHLTESAAPAATDANASANDHLADDGEDHADGAKPGKPRRAAQQPLPQ